LAGGGREGAASLATADIILNIKISNYIFQQEVPNPVVPLTLGTLTFFYHSTAKQKSILKQRNRAYLTEMSKLESFQKREK
jgi:hypothetical protein